MARASKGRGGGIRPEVRASRSPHAPRAFGPYNIVRRKHLVVKVVTGQRPHAQPKKS
jgi:hypothetical protein